MHRILVQTESWRAQLGTAEANEQITHCCRVQADENTVVADYRIQKNNGNGYMFAWTWREQYISIDSCIHRARIWDSIQEMCKVHESDVFSNGPANDISREPKQWNLPIVPTFYRTFLPILSSGCWFLFDISKTTEDSSFTRVFTSPCSSF